MILQVLLPVAVTLLFYVLFHGLQILYGNMTSTLRYVDGPKSSSFLFGNSREIGADSYLTSRWAEQFGRIFLFHGLFSTCTRPTSKLSLTS
ncbi:hypothetical protein C8R45DRAFT_1030232 [Mycena sanguinolenta]|nr:hypothetical protein C8R45DRAFT_1030232 [Mycena sanguinolenta]